jgi:hypothetical protein
MSSRFFMTSMLGHTRREVVTACSTWRGGLHVDRAAAFLELRHRLGRLKTTIARGAPRKLRSRRVRMHARYNPPIEHDHPRNAHKAR